MAVIDQFQFARTMRQVRDVTSWPRARLQQIQRQRFEQLLTRTLANSPFYRRKYGTIDVQRIPLEELPPTTKEELRTNFDEVVTDPRLRERELVPFVADERNLGRWYLGKYAVAHTSGSQGAPLLIVQDRHSLNVIFSLMATRCTPHGPPSILEGLRRLWSPKRVAAIAFRRGFYPSGMTLEFMPEILGPFTRLTRLSSLQPDLVDRLNEIQPQVITGYAGVLEALALQKEQLRLPQLESITNSSEHLTPRARNRIEQAFGVPVFDHYGTGECLQLSDACRHCRQLHVNADWAILESVDEQNRPVPAGTVGAKILITNLANGVQPFIRYEVGDRVALSPPGGCSQNSLPQIARMDGRAVEVFWVRHHERDRFLSGVLFHSAVDSLQVVREWRGIQRERNRIEMQLELLPGTTDSGEKLHQLLRNRLIEYGLPSSVDVDVKFVTGLKPDERTGKMRRMRSEIGPPQALRDPEFVAA